MDLRGGVDPAGHGAILAGIVVAGRFDSFDQSVETGICEKAVAINDRSNLVFSRGLIGLLQFKASAANPSISDSIRFTAQSSEPFDLRLDPIRYLQKIIGTIGGRDPQPEIENFEGGSDRAIDLVAIRFGQVQGGLTGAWVQRGFRSLQSVLESRADQHLRFRGKLPWLDRECAWRQQILGSCSPASQSTIRLPPSSVSICTKACASATTSPMSAASWP